MSLELVSMGVSHFSGTGSFSVDHDGLHLINNEYVKSDYIPIRPDIYTFRYDYVISVSGGNMFYIGWERYDKDKTSRSNNACVYTYATMPTTGISYRRYRGTVDLSTDGVNPAAFIRLRVLNLWTNSTAETGTATIHSLNLLGIASNESIMKQAFQNGRFTADHFREFERSWTTNGTDQQVGKVSIARIGHTDSTILYEY